MVEESKILMSSRRTIMSGEVVTFSTSFKEDDGIFGKDYDANGIFEISASREAVMIHRARCINADDTALLVRAINAAESTRSVLSRDQRGGAPSLYQREPTAFN